MADDYLAFLARRCEECDGVVLVATIDETLAGFVCVLANVPPTEPDEGPASYAFVSDLIVLERFRRQGLGARLLEEAESIARAQGATTLRVGVLSRNLAARHLYARMGFAEYQLQLTKSI
jgi:ribosomal protein S18 acetylase RimI-like enzyme